MMIILSSSSATITKYIFSQQQAFGDVETIQRKPSADRTILTTTSATISDFLLYENPTIGIKMEYPASWDKEEPIPNGVLFRFSPQNNISDISSRYLLIMVNTMDPQDNMTLDELTDVQIDFLKESFPNLSLNEYESNTTTLAGNPAYKVIFDHKEGRQQQGDLDFRLIQIWTIKGDKVYYITYREELGKQEDSDNYLKTIQKMIDSFQISDFLLYENPTIGIKMEYPIDWQEKKAQDGSNVTFISPPQSNFDMYHANVTITTKSLSKNITLDQYGADIFINGLKKNATEFRIVEETPTTIGGNNTAYKIVYTTKDAQKVLKVMAFLTIKDDKVYLIEYRSLCW